LYYEIYVNIFSFTHYSSHENLMRVSKIFKSIICRQYNNTWIQTLNYNEKQLEFVVKVYINFHKSLDDTIIKYYDSIHENNK
jgi:hypothetical protein